MQIHPVKMNTTTRDQNLTVTEMYEKKIGYQE